MFRVKVDTHKAEQKLKEVSSELKSLPIEYATKGAKKGYRACSKLLRKLYALPQSSSNKLARPGVRQVLKRDEELTNEGVACVVSASTKPLSLIRFVEGNKIIPYSTKKNKRRLKIAGVAGKSWETKSSFSAYGNNNNLHVFLKRKNKSGKIKMFSEKLPSAFALLSKDFSQKEISRVLDKL